MDGWDPYWNSLYERPVTESAGETIIKTTFFARYPRQDVSRDLSNRSNMADCAGVDIRRRGRTGVTIRDHTCYPNLWDRHPHRGSSNADGVPGGVFPTCRPASPRRFHGVRPAFPAVTITGSQRQESSPGQAHSPGHPAADQSGLPITRGWSTDRLPVGVLGAGEKGSVSVSPSVCLRGPPRLTTKMNFTVVEGVIEDFTRDWFHRFSSESPVKLLLRTDRCG